MQQSSSSTDTLILDGILNNIDEEILSSSDTQRAETEATQQTETEATQRTETEATQQTETESAQQTETEATTPKSTTVTEEVESSYMTGESSTPANPRKRKRPSLTSDMKEINNAFIKTLGTFQGYLDNSKKDTIPMTEDDTFGKTVSAMITTLNSNNKKTAKAKILTYLSSLQLFENECFDDFIMPNLT